MSRTNAMKITVQISYTDTAERVQDLLRHIHSMEKAKKNQLSPRADKPWLRALALLEERGEPF